MHSLTSFYRCFVKDLSTLATPLTKIVKNYIGFKWCNEHKDAFKLLNESLCFVLVLDLPDFTKTFEIECDASSICIGAVLIHDKSLITYFSKKINKTALNYPIYDK